jgi:hypothetical protein
MKAGTKIGAALGVVVFLVFGVVPAFYFGSFGVLVLLSYLAGGPLDAAHIGKIFIVNIFTVAGIIIGIFCLGTVFIAIGAAFGKAIGYIIDRVRSISWSKTKSTAETSNIRVHN